jgi:uncharacterized protein (TIGR02271 family)
MDMQALQEARGLPVLASDGEQIGKVEEIFYDESSNQPEWVGIGTGFLGTKRVLVPLQAAELQGDALLVPYPKEQVKGSPDIDSDHIDGTTEQALYSYYGLGGAQQQAPVETRADGGDTVTRSEEELQVGKRDVDAGKVRLRKWVETEPVQMDVELHRETARVTREAIDEPVGDEAIGEEQIEVALHEEQPLVAKQTVAKERIGLEKQVETEHRVVQDEVRKERVEVEGDQGSGV